MTSREIHRKEPGVWHCYFMPGKPQMQLRRQQRLHDFQLQEEHGRQHLSSWNNQLEGSVFAHIFVFKIYWTCILPHFTSCCWFCWGCCLLFDIRIWFCCKRMACWRGSHISSLFDFKIEINPMDHPDLHQVSSSREFSSWNMIED